MTNAREELRTWILSRRGASAASLPDDAPLLPGGWLTSLDLLELITYLERLRGRPVDVESLGPGAFRNLDTLCTRFLGDLR